MVVLDVLGRRGALRVLWELRNGALTFRALQEACETNPGSLNARLKDLRELGTSITRTAVIASATVAAA